MNKKYTKFKVDNDTLPINEDWFHLLKPEVRLKAQKYWEKTEAIVEEGSKNGTIKIDPSVPKKKYVIAIPNHQLMKKEDLN